MRRIYDSQALAREDGPFTPREREDDPAPAAMRSVPGAALSRLLVPQWLCHRAIRVSVETPERAYPAGADVPLTVTLRNALPVPISVRTRTPRLWTWHVDGAPEASRIPESTPDEERVFTFDRGERKRFRRRWSGLFRVSESEWEPATPGEYTVGVAIDIDDAAAKGLAAETTVRIESA